MNEASPSSVTDQTTPQQPAGVAAPQRWGRRRVLVTLLVAALLLVVAYAVLEARRAAKQQRLLAEMRAREVVEATTRAQAAVQQAQDAQKKLAELEQLAAEAAAAESAAAPGRDDVVLFEVERLVTLAAQDLQLTRQSAAALAALELADARLATGNVARWAPLRRALARDVERLRAVPTVDTTGIALKLDQLIAGADLWPMGNAPAAPPVSPAATRAAPRAAAKKVEPPPEPPPPLTAWQQLRAWLTAEFGELIRINEVATPETLLLTGEQEKLVRQQLKLRLLGARLALLARSDRLYHSDLENAQTLLALYFEGRTPAVASAAATLRQLNTTALAFEVPTLADSQAALRAARAKRP
jgi:uncharacterized protein HemX